MQLIPIMLVDDEIQALEYLESLIDWEAHGYHIVATATDGRAALQKFRESSPQIIISDISMPGMNGLEFCSEILQMDTGVQIILLTAYSEFAYAQKAVSLGVMSYLLKHVVDEKLLITELAKARQVIEKSNNVKKALTHHLLRSYMENDQLPDDSLQTDFIFNENRQGGLLLFSVWQDHAMLFPENQNEQDVPLVDSNRFIRLIIDLLPAGFRFIDILISRNRIYNLLFQVSEQVPPEMLSQKFMPAARQILAGLPELSPEQTYSGAVGFKASNVGQIADLYKQALSIMENIVPHKRSTLYSPDFISENRRSGQPACLDAQGLAELASALDAYDENRLVQTIQRLFIPLQPLWLDREDLTAICRQLSALLESWFKENQMIQVDYRQMETDALHHCFTLDDVREAWQTLALMLINRISDRKYAGYSHKTKAVVRYLYRHYATDLSVTDAAEVVNLSASRLSRLFKNETGYGVLEYLTWIRIRKAMILLKQEHIRIYEISEAVGYKTSQYFSEVFTKLTGMTPNEYRERGEAID